ncbi:hypothetical protein [Phaeovulum vinaykumarii]|uniref:Uncharacterized protein n=1 Tax=Phaeovulum vinaykumarii TaxID=407234 RepID=A0A1N7M4T1_9RHOB|nr:hypothetical protein [Phaeovulum vinaykumarii]SIS81125.1 hypothetical protein SAMN05421795_105197 [Phaeovulum vinaykumarii]SOC08665.1 hypothetical protein SAMN05878426_1055 [Phaeovulum vinaykumarii]
MADAMLISAQTAEVTMRNIREGGMMTTGARGVNAPDLTYVDAARTLIAQIVEENPGRRALRHVSEIGSLPLQNKASLRDDEPFSLHVMLPGENIETFERALAALIKVFAEFREDDRMIRAGTRKREGWLKPLCRVEVSPPDLWAQIDMGPMQYQFGEFKSAVNSALENDERFRLGRQSLCFVNQEVIAKIADGFADTAEGGN